MNFTVCQFKPKGPFHLGEREGWLEGTNTFIHSDTLFSAFLNAFLLLFGEKELENLISSFENNEPPFLISSAFPYWQDLLFFPVPKNQISIEKKVKKIEFVEQRGFEELLKGKRLDNLLNGLKKIPQDEEPYYPWSVENVPRVGLSRFDNHPGERFFYFGQISYKDNAGLFFLIKYLNKSFKDKLEATMRLLADEGIGGDRSSGKGLFELLNFREIEIKVPDDADGVITLSLYYPKDESEIKGIEKGFYELLERKGYI
ncbi:MAG: type III-A CRISPR-associated RAMP protein Csm4, partial [candidate division WOR-3 bacterium]|nr:type III-A CRISPR-associated RAMP protein Csm4 [candidate division WOR-3 bacterium]